MNTKPSKGVSSRQERRGIEAKLRRGQRLELRIMRAREERLAKLKRAVDAETAVAGVDDGLAGRAADASAPGPDEQAESPDEHIQHDERRDEQRPHEEPSPA